METTPKSIAFNSNTTNCGERHRFGASHEHSNSSIWTPPSNQASTPTHEDNVVSQDANQNTPPVPQQVPPLIVVNPERPKRSCGPPKRLITTMDYLNFDLLDEEQI